MNMEDKESTDSGSFLGNSDPESPPLTSTAVVGGVNGAHGGFMMPPPQPQPPTMSSGGLTDKKKRGRPRKYDGEGNLNPQYMASPPANGGFSISSPSGQFSTTKRGRGRPHASANWHCFATMGEVFANTAGADFIPHVVTVHTGEDVAGKLLSISQNGSRGICILSANGTISNATIRQPGFSGGLLTYEGRFEILTLTGSFTPSENNGMKSRTGGLSISLAGPDGRVVGGGVAGGLLAASPIQVVFGSFMPNSNRVHKRKHHIGTPMVNNAPDIVTEATPISQATLANNIAPVPTAPFSVQATLANNIAPVPTPPFSVQSRGEVNNSLFNDRVNSNTALTGGAEYNNPGPSLDARHYPDINVSISFD